jgi:hypothetical protein
VRFFVTGTDGVEYGPVEVPVLRHWIAEGRILPDSSVRDEHGMVAKASQITFLADLFEPDLPANRISAPTAASFGVPQVFDPKAAAIHAAANPEPAEPESLEAFTICLLLCLGTLLAETLFSIVGIAVGAYTIWRAYEDYQLDEKWMKAGLICACASAFLGIFCHIAFIQLLLNRK